jgi:hypothetical protein
MNHSIFIGKRVKNDWCERASLSLLSFPLNHNLAAHLHILSEYKHNIHASNTMLES